MSSVLRVALVADAFPPRMGGIERHVAGLAGALAARGHDVHVYTTVTAASPPPPASAEATAGKHPPVTVHRLPYARVESLGVALPNFAKLRPMRALFARAAFDIVHAHGLFSPLALGGVLVAARLRIPSVLTVHSLLRGAVRPAARAVFAIWARRADVVAAVSQTAAREVRQAAHRDDVPVMPNGVDVAAWRGQIPEPDGCRLVSVMRLVPKKRPLDLVRALPRVLAQVPQSSRIVLTIVGDGPMRRPLEQEIARLGLSAHVELTGTLAPEGVRAVLASSRLFVLASPEEAFGVAALEARAAGLPIVAVNRAGALDELVEQGRDGLLVESSKQLADSIARLVEDDQLRRRMRRATREGLDRFDWDAVAARHLELYRATIETRRAALKEWSAA
jgi:glycosyltransferase involved in cell wall biosynthesis